MYYSSTLSHLPLVTLHEVLCMASKIAPVACVHLSCLLQLGSSLELPYGRAAPSSGPATRLVRGLLDAWHTDVCERCELFPHWPHTSLLIKVH